MSSPFVPLDLSMLAMFQAPGEWAINGPGGAIFPGEPGYDQSAAAAKAGRTNPAATGAPAPHEETMSEWWSRITGGVSAGNVANTVAKATIPGYSAFAELDRVVAIVLGLILILGGVLLFKPVRETVVTTAKTAAKAAAVAA